MTEEEQSIDMLFETLTLTKNLEPALSPTNYGYETQWGYVPGWHVSGYDTVYRNIEGQKHRIYGPAYISEVYSIKEWYRNGKLHREDGPAVVLKKSEIWFLNGKKHRIGGPAVTSKGGPNGYWINGKKYKPKEYKKEMRRRGVI